MEQNLKSDNKYDVLTNKSSKFLFCRFGIFFKNEKSGNATNKTLTYTGRPRRSG